MTLDLFAPIARTADPETSHAAADAKTRSGSRKRDADRLVDLIRRYPLRTAMEYAQLMIEGGELWLRAYQIASKRLSDLDRAGRIYHLGARKCRVSGKRAREWMAR